MSPALKRRYWQALPSRYPDLHEKTAADYLAKLSEADLAWLAEFNRSEMFSDRAAGKRDIFNQGWTAVPLDDSQPQPAYGDRRGRYKRVAGAAK